MYRKRLILKQFRTLALEERALTAVEFSVVLALIAVGSLLGVRSMGVELSNGLTNVSVGLEGDFTSPLDAAGNAASDDSSAGEAEDDPGGTSSSGAPSGGGDSGQGDDGAAAETPGNANGNGHGHAYGHGNGNGQGNGHGNAYGHGNGNGNAYGRGR